MITILDPIHCRASRDIIHLIKPIVKYTKKYRKQTRYGSEIKPYTAHLIDKDGLFLSGHLPRIMGQDWAKDIEGEFEKLEPEKKPKLKGIKPRDDQLMLVDVAIKQQRGVLLSPTGSGKTVVAMLLISCFPKSKVLFMCHSLSIIGQTKQEMEKFGFKKIQVLGGGDSAFDRSYDITLATVQTLVKIKAKRYSDFFDITIMDECHHLNSPKCQAAKIMAKNFSPIRIGLTATMPSDSYGKLCLEGFLGPIIGEVTVQEGVESGMLAKPKVKLLPVQYSESVADMRMYRDIYEHGIVRNKVRNRAILEEAFSQTSEGRSVLIMVKEIAHGDNLVSMAKSIFGTDIIFVQGMTEAKARREIQKTLDSKSIKCVVCTAVWREGINIRSLNTVILALGGKSAIQTAQALGRGLRIDDGKDSVLLVDFLDQPRYLAQHAIARLNLYVRNGWM